jgi:hypothetical protein
MECGASFPTGGTRLLCWSYPGSKPRWTRRNGWENGVMGREMSILVRGAPRFPIITSLSNWSIFQIPTHASRRLTGIQRHKIRSMAPEEHQPYYLPLESCFNFSFSLFVKLSMPFLLILSKRWSSSFSLFRLLELYLSSIL